MRARISRTWIGLRTTSSTPAANRSSVSSRDLLSFMAMIAARERPLISLGKTWRWLQSPSRNASTARISGSDTVLTQLPKSDGLSPVAETPSRSNQAEYPSDTESRSSTITIIGYPPNRIDRRLRWPYVCDSASSTGACVPALVAERRPALSTTNRDSKVSLAGSRGDCGTRCSARCVEACRELRLDANERKRTALAAKCGSELRDAARDTFV